MIAIVDVPSEPGWLRFIPLIGQAITAIGITLVGLWRYYKLAEIEVEAADRRAHEPT